MTGENRRRNAEDELARVETCFMEARTLRSAGFPFGAASRAYYAVFHGAQALLFSTRIETRSHKGLVAMLGDHFVKPGRLSTPMGRLVSRMQRDCDDADYGTGAVFTDQEASQMIANAEAFLADARKLIATGA